MAKGDFIYKVSAEADLGNLQSEVAKINSALAAARGSVSAFKAEFERDAKGEAEYRIVVSSQYDASGSKVAKAEIKELSKEYQGLYNKIRQIESEPQKGSLTSLRQQVNEAKKARDAIAKYGSAIDGIGNKIQALDGKWVAQNQRVRDLQKQLDLAGASNLWERLSAEYNLGSFAKAGQQISNFVNIFQSVSIIAGQVTGAINNVVNALGGLQTFTLAFEAVGAGAGAANLALAESTRIASGLGTDIKTVRESFQQLSPVILKSGGSIADVSGVVETLSSRFAAYGISGDRARRVTNGVIQAFAKGKLMAEELTQQISEADPAFKTDLAGAMKVTVAGLEELVQAGKVTSAVFLKALLEIGKSDLLFGRLGISAIDAANSLATAGTTVDQVRAKLGTIGQLSLERFAKSVEPVVFAFIKLGAIVTDAFDRISRLQGLDSIGNIIGDLAGAFVRITDAVLRFAEAGLSVLGVVAKFVNVLTSIPGVTDIIALAIASKLIAPLAGLKAAFGASISSATNFGKTIRAVTTFTGLGEAIKGIGQQSVSAAVQIRKLGVEKSMLARKSAFATTNIERLEGKVQGYQKVVRGLQSIPDFGANPQAQASVDQYTKKIEKTKGAIGTLRQSLLGINSDQFRVSASLDALTNKKGLAAKASGVFRGALGAAGGAAKGLIVALGPLGIALAAFSVLTAAYQNANKNSNSILEQSQARVAALKLELDALNGTTASQEPRITGLALVWEKFSLVVSDVVDTLARLSSAIFGGGDAASSATKQTNPLVDALGRLAAGAAAGALAGGALGLAFAGIGAGPGAAIGALIGGLVGLAAGSDDAAVKSKKLGEALQATGSAVIGETNAIKALVTGLGGINEKDLDIKSTKTIAGFNQAQTALKLVEKTVDGVKLQQTALNNEAAKLAPGVGAAQAQYEKVKQAEEQLIKLQKQRAAAGFKAGEAPPGTSKLRKEIEEGEEALREQKRLLKEIADTDPNSKKYLELQTSLAQVNKTVKTSEAAYSSAKKEIDDFARANGLLTTEQQKTVPTIAGQNEKIKELQTTLQTSLNPKVTPQKWKELSGEIATATVELDALNDAITDSVGNELVYTIKTKIDSGEINNSVQNAQRLVQALEQRATVLGVTSPALAGVIRELEAARSAADTLNGKQAEIRVNILEQKGANSTIATLSEISRYIDALEQRKISLPINSSEISGVIENQNQAKLLQDAGSKSSGELRRIIQTDYWQQELQGLQASNTAQKEASSARLAELQEQLSRVKEVADARIKAISQAGAAEKRLAEINRQELQEQASKGGTEKERVSARAQLERLDKEKEIAAIQEQTAREEKAIQAQIKAEQKAAQEEEKVFRAAQLAIQQELLKLAREEVQAKIDAAKAVLEARAKAGEVGGELGTAVTNSNLLKNSLEAGATAAGKIQSSITSLDGKTITINIKTAGAPGLWTGGPASPGTTYRVNELGKEGFLSNSGRLTDINRPRNALWSPPTSGTVIPAHMMRSIDVPKTGINVAKSKVSRVASSMHSAGGSNALVRELRRITASNQGGELKNEIATTHAAQTMEIGRLTRAVRELVDKDWNVNVKVRNNSGAAYMNALNRLS